MGTRPPVRPLFERLSRTADVRAAVARASARPMSGGSSHAEADDAAWRECASYEERFTRPALLEFQPSGVRLELEQSGGDGSGFDFDQVTVWPAGVVMARALQHPSMAIAIAGRRVLELGSGCGVAGLMAHAMGAAHVSLTDLPAVLPVLTRNAQRSCGSGSGGSGGDGSGGGGSGGGGDCGDGGGVDAKWEVWALEWDDEDRAAQVARAGPLDVILGADVAKYGARRRPGRGLSEMRPQMRPQRPSAPSQPTLSPRECKVRVRVRGRVRVRVRVSAAFGPRRSRRLCSCCRIWPAPCTRSPRLRPRFTLRRAAAATATSWRRSSRRRASR